MSKQLRCEFVRLYLNLRYMSFYVRFPCYKTQIIYDNDTKNTVPASSFF